MGARATGSALNALRGFALARGLSLSDEQFQRLSLYAQLVLEANPKVNLTADAEPDALLLRHMADGLAAVAPLKARLAAAARLADLGSGGGFIGAAIKIAWPEAEMTLIEGLKRKYEFLNAASLKLGLKGLRVLKRRAGMDRFTAAESGFDAVVERALAPLPQSVEWAAPLAKAGGLVLAYQSAAPDPAEPALAAALAKTGAKLIESYAYRLPAEDKDRTLAIFETGSDR